MSNKQEYIDLFIWATLAGTGGLARFFADRMSMDAPALSKTRYFFLIFANFFVSAFSGMMGALVMSEITESVRWQMAAAGVFGFMGAKGLEMLSDKLSSKIQ